MADASNKITDVKLSERYSIIDDCFMFVAVFHVGESRQVVYSDPFHGDDAAAARSAALAGLLAHVQTMWAPA